MIGIGLIFKIIICCLITDIDQVSFLDSFYGIK